MNFQFSIFNFQLRKFALIAVICLGFISLCTHTVNAQAPIKVDQSQIISVSPAIIPLVLNPGHTISTEITVTNLLSVPLPLQIQRSDFQTTGEDGGYVFQDTHNNPLLSWMQLSDNEILLPAKAKQTITVTIPVPKVVPVGGYYGLLFFDPVLPTANPTNTSTSISARVGVLFLANVGIVDANAVKANILTFSLGNIFDQSNELPLVLRVENTSLNYITAKPILLVQPLFGNPEEKYILEDKVIFPGKVRRWEQPVQLKDAKPGIYNVTLNMSTGEGHYIVYKTMFVIAPLLPIVAILFFILVAFLLSFKRKNVVRMLRILAGKE